MNNSFTNIDYFLIENEFEHSHYHVLCDVPLEIMNRYYIDLENVKNGENAKLEISPYMGTTKILVKQNIMKHLPDHCNYWTVARKIGNVLYLGWRNF